MSITNLTIKEAEGQEECSRDDYRQMFNVDYLDGDDGRCRKHHCCNRKAGRGLSAGGMGTRPSCGN
jgi:hypothetical protein